MSSMSGIDKGLTGVRLCSGWDRHPRGVGSRPRHEGESPIPRGARAGPLSRAAQEGHVCDLGLGQVTWSMATTLQLLTQEATAAGGSWGRSGQLTPLSSRRLSQAPARCFLTSVSSLEQAIKPTFYSVLLTDWAWRLAAGPQINLATTSPGGRGQGHFLSSSCQEPRSLPWLPEVDPVRASLPSSCLPGCVD